MSYRRRSNCEYNKGHRAFPGFQVLVAVILSAISLCLHIMVSFCVESLIVSQHSGIYINICCHYITHMPDRNCLAIYNFIIIIIIIQSSNSSSCGSSSICLLSYKNSQISEWLGLNVNLATGIIRTHPGPTDGTVNHECVTKVTF